MYLSQLFKARYFNLENLYFAAISLWQDRDRYAYVDLLYSRTMGWRLHVSAGPWIESRKLTREEARLELDRAKRWSNDKR